MREQGHEADILATNWQAGPDYERARLDGWPVEAICVGQRWLRRRLRTTLNRLASYDVVINNHSTETSLILATLPTSTIRLSVIRSTNGSVISDAKWQSPYLDALIAISPEVQRLLSLAGVGCQTRVIPNSTMVAHHRKPALAEPLELAYLGRLTDIDKNILILPEIALACNELGMEFSLSVAGEGTDRQRLEASIHKCGLTSCIRMIGAIPRDAVGEFLSERHFGVFPSNYEGFGLSLLESMAVGCVPIASDIPAYRWILGEDADTLLVPVKDATAYAQRIYMLARNPERYRQIQERLQRRQREKFTPQATVNGYLDLIERIARNGHWDRISVVPFRKLTLPKAYRRSFSPYWPVLHRIKVIWQAITCSLSR